MRANGNEKGRYEIIVNFGNSNVHPFPFSLAVQEERTPQMTKPQQPQRANTPTQLGFPGYILPPPPPSMFRNFDSPTSPIPAILGQNSRLFGSLPNLKMQFGQDLSHGSSMSNLIPSSSEVFPSSFILQLLLVRPPLALVLLFSTLVLHSHLTSAPMYSWMLTCKQMNHPRKSRSQRME